MQKVNKHGKPGSPFGGGVTQFPDKLDTTVQLPDKAPETTEEKGLIPAEQPDGTVTTSKKAPPLPTILDFIPEGTAKLITQEQRDALSQNINTLGYAWEAAMVCEDHECTFKAKCHLFRAKVPRPRGEECPVEMFQAKTYKAMLTDSLSKEDQEDPFLAIQINDLVHIMMIEARAYGQFGIDGGVIEVDDVKGFNPITGEHVIAKVVNRAISILEKTGKRKERLLSKLLATPQDRAKADRDGIYDRSKKAAEIGARIAKVAKERKDSMRKQGREVFVVERINVEDTPTTKIIDVPVE